jgi:O-phospho-L-seryl-tRNASec:L-selenocysteinyl-tRNA synthase
MAYLRERMSALAAKHGERLLQTPNNPISLGARAAVAAVAAACTASILMAAERVCVYVCVSRHPCGETTAMTLQAGGERGASYLGSMLFSRNVSGPRVVAPGTKATVEGVSFAG